MNTRILKRFASQCVHHYAKFYCDQYYLNIIDLPDFIRHEFSALIMSEDENYASEATGKDNKLWESKMFPSLLKHLQDSTDVDKSIEFKNTWRDSITEYFYPNMQELIDDSLSEYNGEQGCLIKLERYYGVENNARI